MTVSPANQSSRWAVLAASVFALAVCSVSALAQQAQPIQLTPQKLAPPTAPAPDAVTTPIGAVKPIPVSVEPAASTVSPTVPGGVQIGNLENIDPDTAGTLSQAQVGLAQRLGFYGGKRLLELLLDGQLHLIGQLFSIAREKLYTVVVVWIVGSADDDAGLCMKRTGQIGDPRCGHRPEHHDISAGGHKPCLQCGFKHVAGDAGVLADHHPAAGIPAQHATGGPPQSEHELRVDLAFAHAAPDAISPKKPFFHLNVPLICSLC